MPDSSSYPSRPQIAVFDTAASSRNLGDLVIMDAVRRQLRKTVPEAFFVTVPTHDFLSIEGRKLVEQSALSIVGGTNLLCSQIQAYNQWKVRWRDTIWLKDVVLLGVGWWQYQKPANRRTRIFQQRVLSHYLPHSLRDEYSASQLRKSGFENVLNTSCVTLWDIEPAVQQQIPARKASSVVTTLTDYKPDPGKDGLMLEVLRRRYDEVLVWIQGAGDYAYIRELGVHGLTIVDPQLEAYDEVLQSSRDLDYIGTRLHAGVRAMLHRRRAMILGVDNRATEIARDIALPVMERDGSLESLEKWIDGENPTVLNLPWDKIDEWRQAIRTYLGLAALPPTSSQVT